MALGTSDTELLLIHPFIVMLKPAVAMSAQPDYMILIISLIETVIFLEIGLWMAEKLRYE